MKRRISALHHIPVNAHLEEVVLDSSASCKSGCHVAMIQIAQVATDQNPT